MICFFRFFLRFRSAYSLYKANILAAFSIDVYFLYAYSPCTIQYFWNIQRWYHVKETALKLSYSPNKIKYFWHILPVRFNTFGVFSVYVQILFVHILRKYAENIFMFTLPDDFKDSISKKLNGQLYIGLQLLFFGYLSKNILSVRRIRLTTKSAWDGVISC